MTSSSKWTAQDLPALDGRTFVVTGANSGIGLVAARALGRAGARVVLPRSGRSTSPISPRCARSPTAGTATSTCSSTTPA
jgi:NAD(P)-dependent dehydrogenase (short-subunit alcohol dehydrogenase family)